MTYCDCIAILSLQATFQMAALGYPSELTEDAPDEEQVTIISSNGNDNRSNNVNIDVINPENVTASLWDLLGAEMTPHNATENEPKERMPSKESDDYTSQNDTENLESKVKDNFTSEDTDENSDEMTADTPNDGEEETDDQYQEEHTEAVDEEKLREEIRAKRKGLVGKCTYNKYVRIEDEYGCQMCTCIYEKTMMLCSPFQCQDFGTLAEQMDPSMYNDYVIGVATHFSEYPCKPGDVVTASNICDCTCVQQNILSCPQTCQLGRPLN